jgi:hypothetical protein
MGLFLLTLLLLLSSLSFITCDKSTDTPLFKAVESGDTWKVKQFIQPLLR